MDNLPENAAMLVSFLNMKLRDEGYDSVDSLCRGLDIEQSEFYDYLAERGVSYFAEGGRFVMD